MKGSEKSCSKEDFNIFTHYKFNIFTHYILTFFLTIKTLFFTMKP